MAITFTKQPSGGTVYRGASKTMSCAATSSDGSALYYSWFRNGSSFGSGSSVSANTSVVGTASYYCKVVETSGGASRESNTAYLTVLATPVPVLDNPSGVTDKTCYLGDTVSFNASATVDSGTLSYQWQRSLTTSSWDNVATSATYSPSTSAVGTYYYRCVVTNKLNGYTTTTTTNVGQVQVLDTPSPSITNTAMGNATYYRGASVSTLKVTATSAKGTLTYQWQTSTDGSSYSAVSGATSASYTPGSKVVGTTYYRVRVTNTLNSKTKTGYSTAAVITVNDTPSPLFDGGGNFSDIGYYLGASITPLGGTAVSASGTVTVQWQKGSTSSSFTNISGATSGTYTPPNSPVGTTYYRAVLTNTLNGYSKSFTSSAAKIVINATPKPAFENSSGVTDKNYYRGDTAAAFNAKATVAAGTLTYQWQRSLTTSSWDNVATTATYTPPTNTISTYYYRCVVTNTLNGYTATSTTNVGQVTVSDIPVPYFSTNTNISDATYYRGAAATQFIAFVSVTKGTITYQWQLSGDGSNFSNISGATERSYVPATKVVGDSYYRLQATSTLNGYTKTIDSVVAKITVNDTPAPSFDGGGNFANAGYYLGGSTTALGGTPVSASGDVTVQWQKGSNTSSFTNISGATGNTYNPPSSTVGTTYYRAVLTNSLNGYTKTFTSDSARIVINDTPSPTITNPGTIANATYYRGQTASTMDATATVALGTLSYVWERARADSGSDWTQMATTPTYTPSTGQAIDYLYHCKVTNTLNGKTKTIISNTPTIVVKVTPTPRLTDNANLNSATYEINADANVLNAECQVEAGTITYQWQSDASGSWKDISGATGKTYAPLTSTSGTISYRCVATNSLYGYTTTYTTSAAAITVQINTYVVITQNPVSATYYRGASAATLRCNATSSGSLALQYTWYDTNGTQVSTGQTYTPSTTTVGSRGYYCQAKDVNGTTARSTTATITVNATPAPYFTGSANMPSATYIQGAQAKALNASAESNAGAVSYQWQSSDNNTAFTAISGATNSTYTPATTAVGVKYYRCVVTNTLNGYSNSITSTAAAITVNEIAQPVIAKHPVGAVYKLLDAATPLTVTVTPSGSYTYQWQSSPDGSAWTNLSGATQSSFTPSTNLAGNTEYRCVVTNGTGSYAKTATSSGAWIEVTFPAIEITKQPQNADYGLNDRAKALEVAAVAKGTTISYQWQKSTDGETNWQDIAGAANNTYTPVTNAYSTAYYRAQVRAGNNGQSRVAYSTAARVRVSTATPPVFLKELVSAAYEGNAAAVPLDGTATASGNTVKYQWYWSQDGETFYPVSGATQPKYTPSTAIEGTKYYYVIATAVYGSDSAFTRSNTATIQVTNVIYSAPVAWQKYLETLRTDYVKLAKLEFLQPDGSVAFALDNNPLNKRSGAFLQEGSLTVNLQNGKRRTATVTLANLDGEYDYNVNKVWFGQQIRLSEGLVLPNGQEFYLPQGVFYLVNPEEKLHHNSSTVTWTLDDKWAYLDGTLFGNLEGIYEVPLGTNLFVAVESVLQLDRGNGQKVDAVQPVFTDYYNDQTTTLADGSTISYVLTPYTARFESDDQTYADVVLEMNTMVAGWVGYDQTGRLRIDPSQDDILDVSKPIQWAFEPGERQFMGATYTVKNSEVFNDIIVTGEGLDEYENVSGRATNFDPASDTNVNLIGRKVKRLSSPGYASDKQCQNLAVFKLKRQTVLQKSVSIESTQIFHLQENQLVTIQRPDKEGQPVERHLVTGFTRPIAQKGSMQIEATSVNDFPVATVNALPWEE